MLKGLLWVLAFQFLAAHPVHFSVTNIEYRTTEHTFSVSIKVFTDDFRALMHHLYGVELDAGLDWSNERDQELISGYFRQSLSLVVNGKKELMLNYLGMDRGDGALWFRFESGKVRNPGLIDLRNSILLELYHDQTNLVILGVGDFEKGLTFTNRVQQTRIKLD